jgi:hypothetical protein
MQLSISQLSELTGRARRTVAEKLNDIPHVAGGWGAMLYGLAILRRSRPVSSDS